VVAKGTRVSTSIKYWWARRSVKGEDRRDGALTLSHVNGVDGVLFEVEKGEFCRGRRGMGDSGSGSNLKEKGSDDCLARGCCCSARPDEALQAGSSRVPRGVWAGRVSHWAAASSCSPWSAVLSCLLRC